MSDVKLDSGTAASKPKSPKHIAAEGIARESLARTYIAGGLLAGLVVALIIALICDKDHIDKILIILGSGLGYLLASRDRRGGDD